jgi:Protein of unknown function (DUF1592)/Protein of unknown function (DUF1588)/Protein of unknown function (DUF1587)/Protein of unknown function (DUF1595)/Protein of unknown function (DUF1585)
MTKVLFDRARAVWAFPLILAAGCSSGEGAPLPSGAAQGGSGSEGKPPGQGPLEMASCPAQPVPRTPLRRLTRFEYQNAVRDLLNVDPSPAAELPADEITSSFDNNAAVLTVSALHAEKYVLVSEALAKKAVQDLNGLVGCDVAAQGEAACARAFAKKLGRRAFRRPTTEADEQSLMTAFEAGHTGGSYAEGIEVMLRAALQSPAFLYRLETTSAADGTTQQVPLDAYEIATRLSFLIWSSIPDDALLDAAASGGLDSKAKVAEKARKMLAEPRARAAVSSFFEQWTGSRRLQVTTKSPTAFPEFTLELGSAMAAELPAFVEHVLWSGDRSLKTLLTAPVAFVNGPLAAAYGVAAPASSGTGLQRVDLPVAQDRSGILTQAGFLSVQAHPDQTSPVLRGKFVRSMLLCQPPSPPPPDIDITIPDVAEAATARERLSGHLAAGASCSGCHSLMDPIGLAFEHFDAMGRYRDTEGGAALDVSGEITGTNDASLAGSFVGVRAMAEKLAASGQVRACMATQWFRYAAGRSEAEADECSLTVMRDSFNSSSGDLLELIVATTQTDAFWFRSPITL